jgi:hypothetical protein
MMLGQQPDPRVAVESPVLLKDEKFLARVAKSRQQIKREDIDFGRASVNEY